MMQQYETVFILTPVLSEDQVKEAVTKFRDYLTSHGAEIEHEEHWGLRKLAYNIKQKKSGFYHLMEFRAPSELLERLEIEYRRDERVVRFLTVKLDKHAIAYSLKRRKQAQDKKEEVESQN